eukprot:snap_masked-scaffold_6-processed-gene-4.41-mRNA-1 protein AED:0.04 eAED:0.04 QI:0/-1/0/1/-1/1/1/0/494
MSTDYASLPYKVADINLADFGRKEIELAEVEMPGLMECRKGDKVLKDVKISGSLHMTIQTAVLIETLTALGAEVRWCSCNIFSTQDHAAAAIAEAKSAAVFAWKGESLEEYWECTLAAISWPKREKEGEFDMIVDDGGDMTLLIHKAVEAEKAVLDGDTKLEKWLAAQDGYDPKAEDKSEATILLELVVREVLAQNLTSGKGRFTLMADNIVGVSEETTTGVHRLYQMAEKGELLFPAINVNDSVTKSKFDNLYGCMHSLPDALMRATDVMLAGKKVLICGFGDVGKGCAKAMKSANCLVYVSEVDPICALQACMEGLAVVRPETVIADVDFIVTATGNKGIVTYELMNKMKNNAVVCNIGHFDNEIDMSDLQTKAKSFEDIKPQVRRYIFEDGHAVIVLAEGRLVNLGCATGHPSFVMSNSFTNQTLAQIELWTNGEKYQRGKVYVLPKHLDERVAKLHLEKLGAELTIMSKEQADYIGVNPEGPFKPESYRY